MHAHVGETSDAARDGVLGISRVRWLLTVVGATEQGQCVGPLRISELTEAQSQVT